MELETDVLSVLSSPGVGRSEVGDTAVSSSATGNPLQWRQETSYYSGWVNCQPRKRLKSVGFPTNLEIKLSCPQRSLRVEPNISLAGRCSPGTSQKALSANQYEFEGDKRKQAPKHQKHSEPKVGISPFSFMAYKFSPRATGNARQVLYLCISQRCRVHRITELFELKEALKTSSSKPLATSRDTFH